MIRKQCNIFIAQRCFLSDAAHMQVCTHKKYGFDNVNFGITKERSYFNNTGKKT